jgi:[FeFe] hydrogenase H-cluster maturation GTPase HydF
MSKGRESTPHIGIFGRRNNGKSSFINCLTGHNTAIVSEVAGTTTDPVKKSYEISGFGPVILVDTAGIDDEGNLGKIRVQKTVDTIKTIDLAILLICHDVFDSYEEKLIGFFKENEIPFIVIHNKTDLGRPGNPLIRKVYNFTQHKLFEFSSVAPVNLDEIVNEIKTNIPETIYSISSLMRGLVKKDDIVLLITPIDSEAPEGRMILPQVQALRSVLDHHAVCIVLKETEVAAFLKKTRIKPSLAITDSQLFPRIRKIFPEDIPLTGFSILFARHKGNFEAYLKGTPQLSKLKNGDRILLLESCTHHVTCDDIGRHKLPKWIKEYSKKDIEFDIVSSLGSYPREVEEYKMVIQCGGCMITRKQLHGRLQPFIEKNIAVTNYGMAIAWMHGIYERAIKPFESIKN